MTELVRVELNEMDLEEIVGGKRYTVRGTKHFLAVRTEPKYRDRNIVAKLHNGNKVQLISKNGGATYWTIKTSNGTVGFVNHRFLRG